MLSGEMIVLLQDKSQEQSMTSGEDNIQAEMTDQQTQDSLNKLPEIPRAI